ncbi:MAG: hypothetical protein EXR43_03915 [Dehalococcoidia bacterium]|nr:hypothetical protein [Dehalococcoidia bacterium]
MHIPTRIGGVLLATALIVSTAVSVSADPPQVQAPRGNPQGQPSVIPGGGENRGQSQFASATAGAGNRPSVTAGRGNTVAHQPPTLPENASPRAKAAVTAAFER